MEVEKNGKLTGAELRVLFALLMGPKSAAQLAPCIDSEATASNVHCTVHRLRRKLRCAEVLLVGGEYCLQQIGTAGLNLSFS